MTTNLKNGLLVAAMSFCLSAGANAQWLDAGLPGVTQHDGWDNLTVTNPQIAGAGFPVFPGATPWPEAIESHTAGSADATFDKTSGFGYPAGASIYSSPFGNGSYQISDDTPVSGLETVVFYIQIGNGSSGWLDGTPTLTINESTLVPLFDTGIIDSTFDPGSPFGAITLQTYGYQWDVSGLGPITSLDVDFTTAGTSTTIYQLQLDQGSTFAAAAVVPEPATSAGLMLAGALTLFARRKRKA